MLPKLATTPAAMLAAMASVLRAFGMSKPLRLAAAAAAPKRADGRGRMPALEVNVAGLARIEFGPDFVADDISAQRVRAGFLQPFGFGEDRGDEDRARVGAQADIVIIVNMGGDAVDQRHGFRVPFTLPKNRLDSEMLI